jgi:hypothetical protein
MSSRPPADTDGERGSAEQNPRPATGGGAPAAGLDGDPEALIAAARTASPEEEISLYEEEADPQGDPKRAARLLHQAGNVRERRLGLVRDAGKAYTQALTADPSLQANNWALFRLFLGRGFWDNLLRLFDAELRFAPLPRPADRADVLVEKGRVLEDRLAREADAVACYRAALDVDPGHPAALLALLLVALRTGAREDAERALAGLAASVGDPEERALLAVELARLVRGPAHDGCDPERARRAGEILQKALLGAAAQEPLLEELDRLSLVADSDELRSRALDVFDSAWRARRGRRASPADSGAAPPWWSRSTARRPGCCRNGVRATPRWRCSSARCARPRLIPC